MSMNSRDERLYHYEYRRPRISNPTYNSSHVFDSLNMFVRGDMPTPLMRSYGKYSLPKDEIILNNKSDIMNSRYQRSNINNSTILPPIQNPRHSVLLNDKDYLYLQMLQQKNSHRRANRTIDQQEMSGSRLSENVQNRSFKGQYNVKGGDSLTKELKSYESQKR